MIIVSRTEFSLLGARAIFAFTSPENVAIILQLYRKWLKVAKTREEFFSFLGLSFLDHYASF